FDFTERVRTCRERSGAMGSDEDGAGASPITTWTFVPLAPKELTPAYRGREPRFHGVLSATTFTGSSDQGISGLGFLKWRFGGSSACWSAITTLMKLRMPAAASRWPMLLLTEPMSSGSSALRPSP